MNVAIINTIRIWGGGEVWTLDAALALGRRGHGVRILAAERAPLAERARRSGVAVCEVPGGFWKRTFAAADLSRAIANPEVDVLLAMTGRDLRLAHRLRGDGRGVRVVVRRGLDRPLADHPFHRRAWREADAIIANSEATRRRLQGDFPWLDPRRIHVLHNAVDADTFLEYAERNVRAELGISRRAFVVGIVGRCSAQKGHDVLLQAAGSLRAALPEFALLVVGDGELRPRLEVLAGRLDPGGSFRFVGEVDSPQPFYMACDVIAIPSRYEGFGYASIEAQLLGRPVVAADVSSLPETLRTAEGGEAETGILVPPDDPEALADALLALARDPERRSRMGEAGRRFVRERFSAERVHARLEELLVGVARGEHLPRARG